MEISDLDQRTAEVIISRLRTGLPPRQYTNLYSCGLEELMSSAKRHVFGSAANGVSLVRFISGSWGSGKTHLFRLLTEEGFNSNFLVSIVEISKDSAPFNKFELVMGEIVRSLTSVQTYASKSNVSGVGGVLEQHIFRLVESSDRHISEVIEDEKQVLWADDSIDADWKRAIIGYWETFKSTAPSNTVLETRGKLAQYLMGDVKLSALPKEYGIQRILKRDNAREFLQSLSALTRFLGFSGLLLLFDEAEMMHSTMSRSNLSAAHNNLRELIDGIDRLENSIMVYAAVPPFFHDDRTGLKVYGALASRVGMPTNEKPRIMQRVWNLDAIDTDLANFGRAAEKIRSIYCKAYPESEATLISIPELIKRIDVVVTEHGQYEAISRWRVVIQECVNVLDLSAEGLDLPNPVDSYLKTKSALEALGDD
jgi:hypothetical protein